jgi:protein-S-isoprenylcysteine O-methyltransferase Ste14
MQYSAGLIVGNRGHILPQVCMRMKMESGTVKLIVFAVISCGLLALSRKGLRVPGSHSFYRFFAWEAILALIILNSDRWFFRPFSFLQIISWLFLIGSLVVLVPGVQLIHRIGKPDARRNDETLLAFEKTSVLITVGLYRYIRHPLYASLLFLAWGAFLKDPVWYSVCLVAAATVGLIATAKADETECLRYFGTAYREYMSRTRMFIPYLF